MIKKTLSVFLAVIMAFSVLGVAAFADESTTEAAPAAKTYKLSELVAGLAAEEDFCILPGDIIELDNTASESLIFDYETDAEDGSKSYSTAKYSYFRDIDQRTGYAVKAIGETTSYAGSTANENKAIDFTNDLGYAFKCWKVTYVYSESNYNKVNVVAVWEIPELEGWDGFIVMLKGYLKTFIDFAAAYLADLFTRIAAYLT